MKSYFGLMLASAVAFSFAGCAGMTPTTPMSEDQKKVGPLHFNPSQSAPIIKAALEVAKERVERQVGRTNLTVEKSFNGGACLKEGSSRACYSVDQKNNLFVQSDFAEGGSYLKLRNPSQRTIQHVDAIQKEIASAITEIDQQCDAYKKDVERNKIEIATPAEWEKLPANVQQSIIYNEKIYFELNQCGNTKFIADYKRVGLSKRFTWSNYGSSSGGIGQVEGYKEVDLPGGTTKISIYSVISSEEKKAKEQAVFDRVKKEADAIRASGGIPWNPPAECRGQLSIAKMDWCNAMKKGHEDAQRFIQMQNKYGGR